MEGWCVYYVCFHICNSLFILFQGANGWGPIAGGGGYPSETCSRGYPKQDRDTPSPDRTGGNTLSIRGGQDTPQAVMQEDFPVYTGRPINTTICNGIPLLMQESPNPSFELNTTCAISYRPLLIGAFLFNFSQRCWLP